jgi:nitroreductase
METWDAITSRRNIREFSDQTIEAGSLDRILEAGRRTPSSRNWQPWDFVVVIDAAQRAELAGVWKGAWHVANAPVAVAIIAPQLDTEREQHILHFDLGQAVMSMMLAAADLGIGTGHAAVADQDLARSILGFPDDRLCAYLISFGFPVDGPLRPLKSVNRRPFEEIVHRHRW